MDDHQLRIERELAWHRQDASLNKKHFLNRWPLYSHYREESAYAVAKDELFRRASRLVPAPRNVLVAPCGFCGDYKFIRNAWPTTKCVGVDISPNAIAAVADETDLYVADILGPMPFPEQSFDMAVATLFFHHVADEGFSPYLNEYARLLKKGGVLIAMEQSMFHPLFLITRPLKRAFGNITGEVEHEHPISLRRLAIECEKAGFRKTITFACSFAHQRVPVPVRAAMNAVCAPLRSAVMVKHLAWQVGLIAWK